MATIRADTHAEENPPAVLKAGTECGPVTQMRVNKHTGRVSYCAHGDYCYPSTNIEVSARTFSATPIPPILRDEEFWIYDVH